MSESTTPFDNLESAHQYIGLLCEALEEAHREIGLEVDSAAAGEAKRRLEALRLVSYKLGRLHQHLESSRRLLNDLQMLRRLLLREPGKQASVPEHEAALEESMK